MNRESAIKGIKIGKYLRMERTKLGYTLQGVADLLEMDVKTYGKMERDESKISLETIQKLISFYNIDMEKFDFKKFLSEGLMVEQNGNNLDNGSSQISLTVNTSEELILQMKERIAELKKSNQEKDERIAELLEKLKGI